MVGDLFNPLPPTSPLPVHWLKDWEEKKQNNTTVATDKLGIMGTGKKEGLVEIWTLFVSTNSLQKI